MSSPVLSFSIFMLIFPGGLLGDAAGLVGFTIRCSHFFLRPLQVVLSSFHTLIVTKSALKAGHSIAIVYVWKFARSVVQHLHIRLQGIILLKLFKQVFGCRLEVAARLENARRGWIKIFYVAPLVRWFLSLLCLLLGLLATNAWHSSLKDRAVSALLDRYCMLWFFINSRKLRKTLVLYETSKRLCIFFLRSSIRCADLLHLCWLFVGVFRHALAVLVNFFVAL